jgi:hypothetical protein
MLEPGGIAERPSSAPSCREGRRSGSREFTVSVGAGLQLNRQSFLT